MIWREKEVTKPLNAHKSKQKSSTGLAVTKAVYDFRVKIPKSTMVDVKPAELTKGNGCSTCKSSYRTCKTS